MESVISRDHTRIAYSRSGNGPPLVLVHGSTSSHVGWDKVRPEFERAFTVFAMDRRGRGESGDAETYSLEREYQDVAAVVEAAGEDASLLGHSSGALCALESALRVHNLRRLVLYEPPFPVGDTPFLAPGLRERLGAMLARGEHEEFLTVFFSEGVDLPDEQIAAMRADPSWDRKIPIAHTALREMAFGDYRLDRARLQRLEVPTLLLLGEYSPARFKASTRALDAALLHSRIVVLQGQGHLAAGTAPELFAREVIDFISG